MTENEETFKYFSELPMKISKFDNGERRVDGKMMKDKLRLSKNDKGAWTKHIVDQYEQGKEMDSAPENMGIEENDIINEIIDREIEDIFGD